MTELRTMAVGAMLVALGSLSMALYTPALPTLVLAFDTTASLVKLSLSVYFCGFAAAQLVCGPLSDAFGRRPVALCFFSIYLAGSLVAVAAPTMEWLIAGRALQGVGVAAGVAISRAMVRDQFTGQSAARIMNLIGLMLAVGPAVAPTIGGILLTMLGWHSIFVAMTACGLAVLLVLAFGTTETNAAPDRAFARPGRVLGGYGMLLVDRAFLRPGLVLGLVLGGHYTLAALLPFVMIEGVGLTPTQYGLATVAQTGSYMAGAAVAHRLLRRFDALSLVPVGLCFVAASGLLLAALWVLAPSFATVMGPVAVWAFGMAMILPGTTVGALALYPMMAGTAAALTGFLQVGGGVLGTAVAALLFGDPLTALATVLPGMALAAVLVHLVMRPA